MAKRKNKKLHSSSIAGRINLKIFFQELMSFLLLDLLIIFLDNQPQISIQAHRPFSFHEIGSFFTFIFLKRKYLTMLTAEGCLLLIRLLFGFFSVRRELRPINELTELTYELTSGHTETENAPGDEEKYRRLEAAIDNIRPLEGDGKILTGEKELLGLEEAVNHLIERMRESYREQARFVSDASHELRTPIAVIKGYADMLDRWGKTDETILNESIEAIRSESQHMNYLVEQLLFLARGDNGRNQMNIIRFDLSDLVQEVFDEYRMIDQDHNYSLKTRQDLWVNGDLPLLKQTMRILLDNGEKYTESGGEINISAEETEDWVLFSVRDNGIGISPEDLPHVFDRFYRADSSRARDTGGTGLGLSIAKWIVEKHGGHFRIISRPNFGTKITVFLPKPKPFDLSQK